MASFMGLFRRWLENDNSGNQGQPTPSDGSNEDNRKIEMLSGSQLETERQKVFQSALLRLQAELKIAKKETTDLQSKHMDALAKKESEYDRLLSELRPENNKLNNRSMVERWKSEQLEKTTDDQKTRQPQQLWIQQESNARQLKELQDMIDKQNAIVQEQRKETVSEESLDSKGDDCHWLNEQLMEVSRRLEDEVKVFVPEQKRLEMAETRLESKAEKMKQLKEQRMETLSQEALDSKETDCHWLNEQLMEVSRRLEDEVKVFVAEQKRREVAEMKLASKVEKVKHLSAQQMDTVRQLNVVKKSLAEERKKFDSVEKYYNETLGRKETEYGKLEQRLMDINSTLEYQTKEMNSERRKNELLKMVVKENKEQVLQLETQHCQQLNSLQGTVDKQLKKLEELKRKMTEVETQRDQLLTSNELNRQKFHNDITDLNSRLESLSRALQEEKELRQALQMQLQEQKKIEDQKDKALKMEKQSREALQMNLEEQKKIEYQKNRALEMEKQSREAFQIQLEEQKKIESQKEKTLEMERQSRIALQQQLEEQKKIEDQKDKALEMEKQSRKALQVQLEEQKKIEDQKEKALEIEKQSRKALQVQLEEQRKIEDQKDKALKMVKQSSEVLQMQLEEQKKMEYQKDKALEMEKQSRKALHVQLEEQKKIEDQKDKALKMEKQSREVLQMQLEEQKKIQCQKDKALEMEKHSREALQMQLEEQKKKQYQEDDKLQNSIKQLQVDDIVVLRKVVETRRKSNAVHENDQLGIELRTQINKLNNRWMAEWKKPEQLEKTREGQKTGTGRQKQKQSREALQLQLKEQKKKQYQEDDKLQNSIKQLQDDDILRLRKVVETQRKRNAVHENDQPGIELRTQINNLNNCWMAEWKKSEQLEKTKEGQKMRPQQLEEQKKIEYEKDKTLEKEKQSREALQMQLEVQKKIEYQKDKALQIEKQSREALQMQLEEQKKIESQKDKALDMERQSREALQMQLEEQKKIESQKDKALEMEKQSRKVLQVQLEEQKKIEDQKDKALKMEKQSREALQIQLEEQKKIEGQKDNALEVEKQSREVLQMQLEVQKEIEYQKDKALQEEKQTFQMQLEEQKKIEYHKDKALEKEKQSLEALQMQLEEQKKIESQKDKALDMERQSMEALQMQLEEQKKIESQKDKALEMERQSREALQMQLEEQRKIEYEKDKTLEMDRQSRKVLQVQLEEQKKIEDQKDKALEVEKQLREVLQMQLEEQKKIESQRYKAFEMEKQSREVLQMQLEEQKKIEYEKEKALEMEKESRETLQMQLVEQKKIEYKMDKALEMEKQLREALHMELKEQKKIQYQKDDKLQNRVKQLSDCRDEILRLTKEVETQREKNVSLENDQLGIVRRANYDCESLQSTVAELQNRLENQAKTMTMEKQKGEDVEKRFQWQSEVLKHQECQLEKTRKELEKEMFSQREIEMSNGRLQNAFVHIDHRSLIAAKDQDFNECKRQLAETREQLESQTQQLAVEREKREAVHLELDDQKKQRLENEDKHKKQLKELKEMLKTLQQTPGVKQKTEGGRGDTLSALGRSPLGASHKGSREDSAKENHRLSMELSVVQDKFERMIDELERERQTRLDFQEQNKQLMAEKDALIKKPTSRISELEKTERSRTEKSDNRNNRPNKRNGDQSMESTNAEPDDINQVIEERNKTNPMRNFEMRPNEEVEKRLKPEAMQLDERMKRISDLYEALDEEKRKNLKVMIQRRHIRSQRDKILQQLQTVQQKSGTEQEMPFQQDMESKMDEDKRETSTDSQTKVHLGNHANGSLEDNTRKDTIDAKTAIGGECSKSNRLNNLFRLDETKIHELQGRVKTLQRDNADAAATDIRRTKETHEEERNQEILIKIKEEPMETKYDETQMQETTLSDEEDPSPRTKRRRIESDSTSTDTSYLSIPNGRFRSIEIKAKPNIKQEPIEEPVRTPMISTSRDRSKGLIANQEPREERLPNIQKEMQTEPVAINRKRFRNPSSLRHTQKKSSTYIATDAKTNATSEAKDMTSNGPSPEEEARLVQTLRLESPKTPLTGVAVLKGSLFVVFERNSVIEVYDSTTFTFSGRVSVEDLTNPQFLTSCPLNSCLYILNRAKPSNAIYRLGLAPHWLHHKWLIGTDFGALASTSSGSLLLSCFDLRMKEFSSSGKLIRQFQIGESTSDLHLFGAVQLSATTEAVETSRVASEAQFAISYSHRRTGLRCVCTIDSNGQEVNPLLKYNGSCTSQHLIIGRQSGTLFLADFVLGEVFQWNAELKNCRRIRREKEDSGFRPMRICLDQNDRRIIIGEVSLNNKGSKLSVYDL